MVSQTARLGIMVVAALSCGTCIAGATPLRVGTSVWPGYEPFYLARELGALEESKVRLIQFRSSTQTMNAFRTGSVEAAALTLDEAVTIASEGVDLTVVQVLDRSNGADVILAQPGIESMRSLAGRRIGVESSAMGAFFLLRALEESGMSLDAITLVRLEPQGQIESFRAGTIDAVVCFEPVRETVRNLGGVEVFSSKAIPGEIVDVLVVRTDMRWAYRSVAAHLNEAWATALANLAAEPDSAYEILGRRMGLDGAAARRAYGGLELLDCVESTRMLAAGGALAASMEKLRAFMVREGLIEKGGLPRAEVAAVCNDGG